MKKFVCPVCGYVHEADEMPADFRCPVCKVPGSKFKVMDNSKLAAEPGTTGAFPARRSLSAAKRSRKRSMPSDRNYKFFFSFSARCGKQ